MASEDSGPAGADLDALLDEALGDFDGTALPSGRASPAPAPSSVAAPSAPPPSEPPALPAAAQVQRKEPKSKPLAFDPLGGSRRPQPRAAAAPTHAATPSGPDDTVNDEELMQGLQHILEELAKCVTTNIGGDVAENEEDSGPAEAFDTAEFLPALSATLSALNDNQPRFPASGSGGSGSGDPSAELLEQLAAQLRGLGEGFDPGAMGEEESEGQRGGAPSRESSSPNAGFSPDMSSLVDTIMHQLLSKEILYQPITDISARYPAWLDANRATLSAEELRRYEEQYVCMQTICSQYEKDANDYPAIMGLLQKMQELGQPPQEIMTDVAPDVNFDGPGGLLGLGGSGGLPPMPPGAECSIQ